MTWQPGVSGNPAGGPKKPRVFEKALRMEIAAAGDDLKILRDVARGLLAKAASGDVAAINTLADRLDGKVPQAVHTGQDDDAGPMQVDGMTDPVEMVRTIAFALAKGRDLLNK